MANASDSNSLVTFEVAAGKFIEFEGQTEQDWKYINTFTDYAEALQAYQMCKGYHFYKIVLIQNNVRYLLQ
jgi:hypothetical protein